MQLIRDPSTPWWVRMLSILVATVLALAIVYLVFMFGYYASGLAVLDEQKKQPKPIPLQFSKP